MDGRRDTQLEVKLRSKLDARKSKSTLRQLSTAPADSVDFSSNDFLSLSTSPTLRAAFLQELERHYATFPLGSGGSRLLDGNSEYADSLESEIARFHGAEAGLLWNSGFDANSGIFACIPQPGDIIIHDELIHASVHDGMRLSRAARCLPFKHNSVAHLQEVILEQCQREPNLTTGDKSIFIAIESVYSMDGDLSPLEDIVRVKNALLPRGNAHIIMDEAHGTGVLGPLGRGLVSQLGLEREVLIRLHTFGKSLACSGAITLCSPLVRSYLINYARPLIYTTFMPFPLLAAIKASYSLLRSGHATHLLQHLHALTAHFHTLITQTIQARNASHLLYLDAVIPSTPHSYSSSSSSSAPPPIPDPSPSTNTNSTTTTHPTSPIFALHTPHPRALAAHCQRAGFVVRAVVPPTVPTRRVRVCLHAGNSVAQVEALVATVDAWLVVRLGAELAATDELASEKEEKEGGPESGVKARL